jgi:DNA-binding NarL/FixJ family response regulator
MNQGGRSKKSSEAVDKNKTEKTDKRRVVLIDDHSLVRDGLSGLLSSRNYVIVASAGTAPEGLEAVRKQDPDLVILDLSLVQTDGLELIKQIKVERPKLPVLVISMHDETIYAERVLRAGARGYIMKKEPSDKIFEAISQILRGEIAVSDRVKQQMLSMASNGRRTEENVNSAFDRLSDRELQVFQLLGNGIRTREIAAQLHLSVKTVESYRENLKVKLNLPDGVALVRHAIQWSRSQAPA